MLLVGGASVALVIPLLADASFFSLNGLLGIDASHTDVAATVATYNSQNLPLPTPAINIDPSSSTGNRALAIADGSALVAESGPSGTEADIEVRPSSSQISVYTVHAGDTLSGIAQLFGVSVNTIIGANNIQHDIIHQGETLVILPITGISHTVLAGETLASLAKTYNSDAHNIAQYNDLADGVTLTAGQTIIIPQAEVNVPLPTTSAQSHKLNNTKPTVVQLARAGKRTAPLHGAGGPDLASFFVWPLNGGIITQGLHGFNAVDIGAPRGTDIYAAAAGSVIVANGDGGWNGGYGNYVVIQHTNGVQTLYAHASRVLVSVGDQVSQGQIIAKVGMTGEATGPHLHFEVRGAENPFGNLALGEGNPL